MIYSVRYKYLKEYVCSSSNQYGVTYRAKPTEKQVHVLMMSAKIDDADGLARIAAISSQLRIPVEYDFSSSPQTVSIEIVSAKDID